MQKIANRVSLGAVHTHTHTHTSTFREIRRVANEAALYCVEDRLFIALYEGKNNFTEIIFCRNQLCKLQRISLQLLLLRNSSNMFFAC